MMRRLSNAWASLALVALILATRVPFESLVSPNEALAEDLVLLLMVASWLAPHKLRQAIWHTTCCAMGITMMALPWNGANC
jgi:hypothetical protein